MIEGFQLLQEATVDGAVTFCQSTSRIWKPWKYSRVQRPLIPLWALEDPTFILPFLHTLDPFDFMFLLLQTVASRFLKCMFKASSERPQFPYLPSSLLITSGFLIVTPFLTKTFLVFPGLCTSPAFPVSHSSQFSPHFWIPSQSLSPSFPVSLLTFSIRLFLICCLLEIWHFCFLNSNLPSPL